LGRKRNIILSDIKKTCLLKPEIPNAGFVTIFLIRLPKSGLQLSLLLKLTNLEVLFTLTFIETDIKKWVLQRNAISTMVMLVGLLS
jgi:hypothetical protein